MITITHGPAEKKTGITLGELKKFLEKVTDSEIDDDMPIKVSISIRGRIQKMEVSG